MRKRALENLVRDAQRGTAVAREELIRCHKAFMAKISSKVCKRYLNWENDDELSVALLAFNEAIDRYDPDSKAGFYTFAHAVIGRRLVDFFRKESRHRNVSLSAMDPEEELSHIDRRISFAQYKQGQQEESFAEVVETYNQTLRSIEYPWPVWSRYRQNTGIPGKHWCARL